MQLFHRGKSDCWVVVDGQVLDVTSFLSEHPGGELAILTFAGKDATEEFNMRLGEEKGILKSFKELLRRIHPPDVIGKYAPDSVIGMIGGGGAAAVVAPKAGAPARTGKRKEHLSHLSVPRNGAGRTRAARCRTTRLGVTWMALPRIGAWIWMTIQVCC